eukprot:6137402-Pleurochrysis_carterae.AAC.1
MSVGSVPWRRGDSCVRVACARRMRSDRAAACGRVRAASLDARDVRSECERAGVQAAGGGRVRVCTGVYGRLRMRAGACGRVRARAGAFGVSERVQGTNC